MAKHKILIVEDEAVTALDLRSELHDLGYEVVGIATMRRTRFERRIGKSRIWS